MWPTECESRILFGSGESLREVLELEFVEKAEPEPEQENPPVAWYLEFLLCDAKHQTPLVVWVWVWVRRAALTVAVEV